MRKKENYWRNVEIRKLDGNGRRTCRLIQDYILEYCDLQVACQKLDIEKFNLTNQNHLLYLSCD